MAKQTKKKSEVECGRMRIKSNGMEELLEKKAY
eukprot:CAMPEP_0197291894 /NCGR_PEP_ID=MMETSP0890-20130614/19863_1 /TAXON_ID=44058 ORGANISM="Aureoumbra lagunensis, Strain CCMP1510" /NCGR_SAMPLE_ID=MMETSP0890 /ASSEMBLY_ACC=CAM_ASM_000533 /LENGTH=32 /DNA_ID= /DNA_START= /DNA_END= /DNA_ORIENTATION=